MSSRGRTTSRPNTIADFEKEYGIKVNYDTYDSTEMAEARLLAGRTGYDVVDHAERYSARLIPIGIYRPLDRSKLTNWKNLDPVGAQDAAVSGSGQSLRRAVSMGHDRVHLQREDDPRAHAGCAGRQRRHDLQAGDRAPFCRLRHHVSRRADRRDPDGDALSRARSEQPRSCAISPRSRSCSRACVRTSATSARRRC